MGRERLGKLKQSCATPTTNTPKNSPILSKRATRSLKSYLQKHGHLLKGHPLRQKQAIPEALGLYQAPLVMVDEKVLGNLIGRSIPTHFSVQQIDKSGRYWVELSLSDIKGLPGVKAWCQANADQFVQYAEARKTADLSTAGHPSAGKRLAT